MREWESERVGERVRERSGTCVPPGDRLGSSEPSNGLLRTLRTEIDPCPKRSYLSFLVLSSAGTGSKSLRGTADPSKNTIDPSKKTRFVLSFDGAPPPQQSITCERRRATMAPEGWDAYQRERAKRMEGAAGAPAGTADRDVEKDVMDTVKEMLPGVELGMEDELVEAGLSDSISHMLLRDQLRKKLGLELPETLVTEYPTVQAITDAVLEAATEKEPPLLLPILYKGNEKSKMEKPSATPFFPGSVKIVSFFSWLAYAIANLFSSKRRKKQYKNRHGDTVYHLKPEVEIPKTTCKLSWDDMLLMRIDLVASLRLPYKADEKNILEGLQKAVATYPSFTGHFEPTGSSASLVFGGNDAFIEVTVGKKTELEGTNPNLPSTVDAKKTPANLYIRTMAFRLFSRAYSRLFHKPAFRACIRYTNAAASSKDVESGAGEPEQTVLQILWSHGLADGNTINKFLSCWAACCRGEASYSTNKGPFKSLTSGQHAAMADDLLRPGYPTMRHQVLQLNDFHFRRLHIPNAKLQELKNICGGNCSDADAVSALLWAAMIDVCAKPSDPKSCEMVRISFMDDLRNFVPELQPYCGNLLCFRPPYSMEGTKLRDTLRSSKMNRCHQSQPVLHYLAKVIREGRERKIYSLQDIEKTSTVPGCHLGEMQYKLTDDRKQCCLAVNDAIPGTRNINMKFRREGPPAIVDEASIQWFPDIPAFNFETLKVLADCPLWQVHLYGAPDGGVHFQLMTAP